MIEIYTKNNCIYCTKAKDILKKRKIDYTEILVSSPEDKQVLQNRVGEEKKINVVPQFFKDGNFLGGYIDFLEYFASRDEIV